MDQITRLRRGPVAQGARLGDPGVGVGDLPGRRCFPLRMCLPAAHHRCGKIHYRATEAAFL